MRSVFLSSLILVLAGCSSIAMDPSFMPAGYARHYEAYKAAPGLEAESIGYDYSAGANEEVIQLWRMVTEDLVAQMEDELSIQPQNIYLHSLPDHNGFNALYDYTLREALSSKGYNVVSYPSEALHLWYEAFLPEDEHLRSKKIPYNNDVSSLLKPIHPEKLYDFVFILSATQEGKALGSVRHIYKVPAYAYMRGEGDYHSLPFAVSEGLK